MGMGLPTIGLNFFQSAQREQLEQAERDAAAADFARLAGGGEGARQDDKPQALNTEKGYELAAKQLQYYLLYTLPEIVNAAKDSGELSPHVNSRVKFTSAKINNGNASVTTTLSRSKNMLAMRKIPPNILSSLVPQIKIFKCHYEGGLAAVKKGLAYEAIYRVPFDDSIYSVGSQESKNRTSDNVLSNLKTTGRGALDLANIVSFNYQYIGTNPAETEVCVTANLKLKFSTIDSLLENRRLINSFKSGTGPRETIQFKGLDFRYYDLVNQAKKTDPLYYRIKVKVGYQTIPKNVLRKLISKNTDNIYGVSSKDIPVSDDETTTGTERVSLVDRIYNAVNDSHVFLYLYPVSHHLSFNDNGTIDLDIDYRGAVESAISDEELNVLLLSETAEKKHETIKKIQLGIKEAEKALEKRRESGDLSGDSKTEEYDSEKDKLNDKTQKALDSVYGQMKEIYSEFTKSIYASSKIKCINYSKEIIGQQSGWGTSEIGDNTNVRLQLARNASEASRSVASINYRGLNSAKDIEDNIKALDAILAERSGSKARSGSGAGSEVNTLPTPISDKLPDTINFIFVKDLIEIVITHFQNKGLLSREDIYILLGNILVPTADRYHALITTLSGTEQKTTNLISKGLYVSIPGANPVITGQYNIGLLPISLEYFNRWFFEKVVDPGKTEWQLKHFLYDIIELVRVSTTMMFGALAAGMPNSRLMMSLNTVNKYFCDTNFRGKSVIDFDDFLNTDGIATLEENSISNTSNILFLYVPSLMIEWIDPLKVLENEKKYRIFTFTVGSNTGLLKNISYKKMEIQGVREARATQEGELETGTFRMKYDCDINMYGPSYFRPGDIIIINPVFYSKSSLTEALPKLADSIGLGGVYMVLKTDTATSRDGLSTKLETVFQSYGTLISNMTESRRKARRQLAGLWSLADPPFQSDIAAEDYFRQQYEFRLADDIEETDTDANAYAARKFAAYQKQAAEREEAEAGDDDVVMRSYRTGR